MPAAALAPALVAGGATVAGGLIQGSAARSASRAQQASADAAVAEQRRQFDLTRSDQQPWLQAGQNALARLQDPNAFQADPGYNFARNEGMRGIERSAAARGGATGGNALRALSQFNQGMADQSYGNWWNRQAGLAGVGQASAQSLGALGAQTASNIGNSLMAGGDARASGIAGQANALSGGLAGLSNIWQYNRMGGFGTPPFAPPTTMTNNYRGPMFGGFA
jgi:hypothetical protein